MKQWRPAGIQQDIGQLASFGMLDTYESCFKNRVEQIVSRLQLIASPYGIKVDTADEQLERLRCLREFRSSLAHMAIHKDKRLQEEMAYKLEFKSHSSCLERNVSSLTKEETYYLGLENSRN